MNKEKEIDKINKTLTVGLDEWMIFDTAESLVTNCDFSAESATIVALLVSISDKVEENTAYVRSIYDELKK